MSAMEMKLFVLSVKKGIERLVGEKKLKTSGQRSRRRECPVWYHVRPAVSKSISSIGLLTKANKKKKITERDLMATEFRIDQRQARQQKKRDEGEES